MSIGLLCIIALKQCFTEGCLIDCVTRSFEFITKYSAKPAESAAQTIPNEAKSFGNLTTIFLFYDNYKKEYSQLTTVGVVLVAMGIYSTINCTNLFLFILSFVFLTVGTFLYLKNLHKQYLWL